MRVQNEKVIKAFLRGKRASSPVRDYCDGVYMRKGASISTDGVILYSYETPIARWATTDDRDGILINSRKYSNTTSRQQADLLALVKEFGYKTAEWA